MAALYFFLTGWAAMIVGAVFSSFSGRLARRLHVICFGAMGVFFLVSAVLLLLMDPWTPPDKAPNPTGVHRPVTIALYSIGLFVAYVGPQITGLILAAISAYILHTAYIGMGRLK